MKMALLGNTLLIKDASDEQRTAIESWNRMEWNTETQIFSGPADLELLSRLARMVRLPPAVAGYRDRLWDEQNAAKYANTRLPEPPYAWLGKLALRGNVLQISDLDSEQFHIIKSWRRLKWEQKTQSFRGMVRDACPLNSLITAAVSGLCRTPLTGNASKNRPRLCTTTL